MTNRELGYLGEQKTCEYLKHKGYKVVTCNFCIRGGEIDIIAENEKDIAFIEVKTRQFDGMVKGMEAITKSKRRLIVKTATAYLYKYPSNLQPRFDVAEVEVMGDMVKDIQYIENAFDASDMGIFC